MSHEVDLLITDASRPDREGTVDVAVRDGRIRAITPSFEGAAAETVDAAGGLVAPGFVDCHMHLDMAYAAAGTDGAWNDERRSVDRFHELMDDHFASEGVEGLAANAERAIRRAVANGTTTIRTHAMVDLSVGADAMRALLRARAATAHLADVRIVPYASRGILSEGAEPKVREALELGLSALDRDRVLLGGMEPASRNRDVERTLDRWFDLAREYDVDLDVHLQDGGTLGAYTVERLLSRVDRHDYAGRVTASHGLCLGSVPEWRAVELAEELAEADVPLVTCYSSTPHEMPLRALHEAGLTVGHGTDNTHDFGFPHGTPDPLLGALVETFKLHGSAVRDRDYRWYETNPGLALLWELLTGGGARALGLAAYGVAEGSPADLVVLDRPTRAGAIQHQATRSAVLKDGRVVARDGRIVAGE
jgi:cytosine/adenosine deaminase-related metal-dependent hydrolase